MLVGPLGKCPAWPCVKTVLDIWRTTRKVGERLRSADTSKRRRNCSHPTIPTTIHHTTTLACLRGQLFFCFFVWPHLCTYQAIQYTALASLETHKSHRQARLL